MARANSTEATRGLVINLRRSQAVPTVATRLPQWKSPSNRDNADAPGLAEFSPVDERQGVVNRVRRLFEESTEPHSRTEHDVTELWSSLKDLSRSHPLVVDAALALAVGIAGVASLSFSHPVGVAPWLLTWVLATPLVLRRRYPSTIFLLLAVIGFVQWLCNLQLVADLSLLVGLFTVADQRPKRVALGAASILEVGAVLATIRWVPVGTSVVSLVFFSGLVAAAVLLGVNVRARRTHVASLVERADRLEIERDQQAQIAASAERTRIAREMHDVIAHSLAVIIALSDGASAKLHRDPDQADHALHLVADLGRQTLDDTRRLLGVLRTSPADDSRLPQPGITEIADLVAQLVATGMQGELRIEGEPFAVAPGLGLSAYRIVQEAITNTLKHADGASSVLVVLSYRGKSFEIDIRDDGRSVASKSPSRVGGFGLQGMRERAAIYDGTVSAGPMPDGGWSVHVSLPIANRSLR